ncbi:hypothetical protein [Albidovulum sp.]
MALDVYLWLTYRLSDVKGQTAMEPHRVFRRLQLLSGIAHHDEDNEQAFTGSVRARRADGIGWRRAM